LVLARKYRPKNFKELIGQDAIREILTLALDKKQLSFAYLFSGLRGSGKTSTARIFAKSLLCERGISSIPCEECSSCKMANSSSHIDIIEIDAASNRRIDDIRELIEHTKYKPAFARFKVFIIDEVHMLTKEAFNALLKTLEEPPEFVKFILATTEPLKLPATILSRTQHFRFKKISNQILCKHLEDILKKEGIEFEKGAIEIVVRFSGGSVRDALTLLEQAIIYSKGFVDVNSVAQMLGTLNPSKIEQLVEDILNRNIDSLKRFINNSAEFEAETIIDELILYLKELLLRGSSMISYQQFGIFFKILEEAKRLLSMGSDGEFVLAITLFKMAESLKRDTIEDGESRDILVESKNQMEDKNSEDIKEIEESFKEPFKKESRKAKEDSDLLKFNALIKKLYNYNMELGEVFEKNIKFISFDGRVLVWESKAIGESREFLKNRFGQIRMYVREVYGEGITIRNISRPNKSQQKKEEQIKTHSIEEIPKERELSNMERWEILKSSEPVIDKIVELFEPHNVILDYKDNLGEVS